MKNFVGVIILSVIFGAIFSGCKKEDIHPNKNNSGVEGTIEMIDGGFPNGVKVTYTDVFDTTLVHTTVSDNDGKFEINNIAAGYYTISVKKDGYHIWSMAIDHGEEETESLFLRIIELRKDYISNFKIKMLTNSTIDNNADELSILDMNRNPINGEIKINMDDAIVNFIIYNGTQHEHTWNIEDNCTVSGWLAPGDSRGYSMFDSFNVTEGTLAPGANVAIVGYINPNVLDLYDRQIYGAIYVTDYSTFSYHTSNKQIKISYNQK